MILRISTATGAATRRICKVLALPRSSFYHAARSSAARLAEAQLGDHIERIFRAHRRRYGYRRILSELSDEGLLCAPARARRIMARRGLRAIAPRKFTPKTSDGRADCPSPNLLLDQPLPAAPNKVWAGDICQRPPALPFGLPAAGYLVPLGSFIPTAAGWRYLAVVIDLCSRKIVGWALAEHLRASLVGDALTQALGSRAHSADLIFHSDRGSQYGSAAFRALLTRHRLRQSMSARANPYHNAWTESFIGTLKSELLEDGCFIDQSDAHTEIFASIDSYYNTSRKHSSIGYLSPSQFESKILSFN